MEQHQLINVIKETVAEVLYRNLPHQDNPIVPIGISNRHVHLSSEHVKRLFGSNYQITKLKDLSQPGQFACNETVTIIGPKGRLSDVRILGPVRGDTQVEISISDGFILGVEPPIRNSGDIEGTPSIILQGPKGQVRLDKGLICAARHIHMHPNNAELFGVSDGEKVNVHIPGERSVTFHNTLIRVSPNYNLEMHIDFDEANTAFVKNGQSGLIVR